jgi:membrane protease YdiL (CAAX protease family)
MSITTPKHPLTAPLDVLEPTRPQPAGSAVVPQYSRRRIMAIWAAAALPMAILAWVVAPWLAGRLDGPVALPQALLLCLTAGLIWQFALVVGLIAREQGTLRWSRIRRALWLQAPRDPGTGRPSRRGWLLLVPLVLAFGVEELLPTFAPVAGHDMGTFLSSDAGHAFLSGAWGWFALIVVLALFNTVLGEELLFRGLLLPRMNGAFGDKDWLANGALFAGYHLHMPWAIPWTLLDSLILAYPSKRYRSALMGIAVHSAQSVVVVGMTLALVLR